MTTTTESTLLAEAMQRLLDVGPGGKNDNTQRFAAAAQEAREALANWRSCRASARDSSHVHVLTVQAKDHPHAISWYFMDRQEAQKAHRMAEASPDIEIVSMVFDDYVCEAHEFANWMAEEGLARG